MYESPFSVINGHYCLKKRQKDTKNVGHGVDGIFNAEDPV